MIDSSDRCQSFGLRRHMIYLIKYWVYVIIYFLYYQNVYPIIIIQNLLDRITIICLNAKTRLIGRRSNFGTVALELQVASTVRPVCPCSSRLFPLLFQSVFPVKNKQYNRNFNKSFHLTARLISPIQIHFNMVLWVDTAHFE